MAGGFAIGWQNAPIIDKSAPTSSRGIVAGLGSAAKGSWAELIASTSQPTSALLVTASRASQSTERLLLDIGVGAAGSEIVVAGNLLAMSSVVIPGCAAWRFPVSIPAGSRISARGLIAISGSDWYVSAICIPDALGSFAPAGLIDDIGVDISGVSGTSVTPSSTANTKGSYSQLAASSSRNYRGFFLSIVGNSSTSGGTNSIPRVTLDIAIGAAGSEKIILPDFQLGTSTNSSYTPYCNWHGKFFPIPIPKGSRIAARSQSNQTNNSGTINMILHGVP